MGSGVEFEEDSIGRTPQRPVFSSQQQPQMASFQQGSTVNINRNDPKMVQWLMKKGFAKTPGAAQGILMVIILLNIIITYFIISYIL